MNTIDICDPSYQREAIGSENQDKICCFLKEYFVSLTFTLNFKTFSVNHDIMVYLYENKFHCISTRNSEVSPVPPVGMTSDTLAAEIAFYHVCLSLSVKICNRYSC